MGDLQPVAFDIETSGFEPSAVVTVAGLAFADKVALILNTDEREADRHSLETELNARVPERVTVVTRNNEQELLEVLGEISEGEINPDGQYLTAYHGETWNGGFDLPFVRTACVRCDVEWPFPSIAYADVLDLVNRFDTNDHSDLVNVYDYLIGEESCDPFEDSGEAVEAFEAGDWEPLLLHNLADIIRTYEISTLAGRYVAKSDFNMKNLAPPSQ